MILSILTARSVAYIEGFELPCNPARAQFREVSSRAVAAYFKLNII